MILIIGLPTFKIKLSKLLSKYQFDNKYFTSSIFSKISFFLYLPFCNSVMSVSCNHKAFLLPILCRVFKIRLNIFWCGSDVIRAKEEFNNNPELFNRRLMLKQTYHYCETNWILDELNSIGIDASICINGNVLFDYDFIQPSSFPDKFSVFTYIGHGKEEFYGIKDVIKLAVEFPAIEFVVVGTNNSYLFDSYQNITSKGWVTDINNIIDNSVVYLRLTNHDSISELVLKSIARGRYVIRTLYNDNLSYTVNNFNEIAQYLNFLINKFYDNTLLLNNKNENLIIYSEKKVINSLEKII